MFLFIQSKKSRPQAEWKEMALKATDLVVVVGEAVVTELGDDRESRL